MLYIDWQEKRPDGSYFKREKRWWQGYPYPVPDNVRVVTFQADGDELDIILRALRQASSGNK